MPPQCEISTVPVFILCISIHGPSFWHVCPYILASDWKLWAWLVNSVGFQCERGRHVVRVVTEDWPRIARWPLDTGVPFLTKIDFQLGTHQHCPLANWRLFTMNVVFQKSDTPCNKIMFTTSAHVSTSIHLLFTIPVIYWNSFLSAQHWIYRVHHSVLCPFHTTLCLLVLLY